MAYDYLFKCVAVGESGVGKSSLLAGYIGQPFDDARPKSVGVEFFMRTIEVRDKTVKLQLWDMSGDPRFGSLVNVYLRGAPAVFLVFDLTQPETLEQLATRWLPLIRQCADPDILLVLIGAKSDLPDATSEPTLRRAKQLAEAEGMQFFTVSVRQNPAALQPAIMHITSILISRPTTAAPMSQGIAMSAPAKSDGMWSPSFDNVFGDLESVFYSISRHVFGSHTSANPGAFAHTRDPPRIVAAARAGAATALSFLVSSVSLLLVDALIVFLVLPSMFVLLVLRMNVVETDTSRLAARAEVLATESAARQSLRWLSTLARGLPASFFIFAVPALIVWKAAPGLSSAATTATIASFLGAILCFQIFGAVRAITAMLQKSAAPASAATELTNSAPEEAQSGHVEAGTGGWLRNRRTGQPVDLKNASNLIVVITLIAETFQLATFALRAPKESIEEEQTDSSVLLQLQQRVFPAIAFDFGDGFLQHAAVWTAVSLALSVVLVCVAQFSFELWKYERLRTTSFAPLRMRVNEVGTSAPTDNTHDFTTGDTHQFYFYSLLGALTYGHGDLRFVAKPVSLVIETISSGLFLVVFSALVTGMLCDADAPHCWSGPTRQWEAFFCLVSAAYYCPLSAMVSPLLVSAPRSSGAGNTISFDKSYCMVSVVGKTALAVASALLLHHGISGESAASASTLVLSAFLFAATAVYSVRWSSSKESKPSQYPFVNAWKLCIFAGGVVAAFISLISLNSRGQPHYDVFGIVYLVLLGVVWASLVLWLRRRDHAYAPLPEH
eukprot:TRINITY_DN6261_c0_g1_i1.p1 TRINITY_DN6261_c0_g1~~TRINITY_DN6261_c0_g1_i1.p1  ORF type:complete len:783 (+),score=194.67 TRINITY_DN6261_c0_g1_i1:3-2351(+)